MLPIPELDDQQYDKILEEAMNVVVSIFPEWTDFNAHDPGITILELFALMKESSQYYLDQIGEENLKKYLKLMGIRRRAKQPAESLVYIDCEEEVELMKGHKLDAGGICFETMHRVQLLTSNMLGCLAVRDGEVTEVLTSGQMEFGNRVRFFVLGEDPRPGDKFYIGFDKYLPFGEKLQLSIRMEDDYGVKRNPIGDFHFAGGPVITWQYYTARGWMDMEVISDEMHGFLFDGFLTFMLEYPMVETEVGDMKGHFIRAVLREGHYDVPPIMTNIGMNMCRVRQQDTLVEMVRLENKGPNLFLDSELSILGMSDVYFCKNGLYYEVDAYEKDYLEGVSKTVITVEDEHIAEAEEFLVINRDISYLHKKHIGEGNGFPDQVIDLEDTRVMEEPFALLIADIDDPLGYRLWEQVEDFAVSKPEDRHFVLDTAKGEVRFGNGFHGMPPEGDILLAAYARTEGANGNVRVGKIDSFRSGRIEGLTVSNLDDAKGGLDEEQLEESFFRAKGQIRKPTCAVTAADYEEYVMHTPGLLIESCRVLMPEEGERLSMNKSDNAIHIVVRPYGFQDVSEVKEQYERNIRAYLEKVRMLGSRIQIHFPEVIAVDVYVELFAETHTRGIKERVKNAVAEFFDRYREDFGKPIVASHLYGFLDRQEFIVGIRSLSLDAKGNEIRRNRDGDIFIPPNGVTVLNEVSVFIRGGEYGW